MGLAACGSGGGTSAGSGNDPNPPLPGTVNDGPGADIDTQTDATTITANWSGFRDLEGQIATYHWAIGVSPGGTEVQDWVDVGLVTAASNSSLGLSVNTTYFVAVRAVDDSQNVSAPAVSDGVTVEDPGGGGGSPATASSLGQGGITWTFDGLYPVGRFANGDWWVVGPVNVVRITPDTTTTSGRVVNGSMINPPANGAQGYDSQLYLSYGGGNLSYFANRNVATGVSAQSPLLVPAGSSLVSTVSLLQPAPNSAARLRSAAVLTVLATAPPAGSFRPPYAGTDKTVRYRESMLDWGALARLNPVAGTPVIETEARLFERVWLDHCPGWISRLMHPLDNMKDYGRDLAADVGSAALLANMDFPQARKRDLVVRLVQLGIDNWGNVQNGCFWDGNGGHSSGRKFPILFAGRLLNDAGMIGLGQSHLSRCIAPGSPSNTGWFGEDSQTFYVQQTTAGTYNWGFGGYTSSHLNRPEWGFSHSINPAEDRSGWNDNPYRRCCTANAWSAYCLATRVMGLRQTWNHQALFDYVDLYMAQEPRNTWNRAWIPWHEAAWDTYRPQF